MDESFYGYPLSEMRVKGLSIKIEEQKLILSDKLGVKWELRPVGNDGKDNPTHLSLYHRSNSGPMHYQGQSKKIGEMSVKRLLEYIADHEIYEAKKKKQRKIQEEE